MAAKEVYVTGVKPTGEIHLGNYISAIKPIIELSKNKKSDIYLFIADLHAFTGLMNENKHDAELTKNTIRSIVAAYISLGVNPKRVAIYKQSSFPQVSELAWIYFCLVNQNYLSIGHAYKDAKTKNETVSLGTFLYPALMAADINIVNGTHVPVGKDQIQHIEIAREFVKKLNSRLNKEIFNEPKEFLVKEKEIVGIDGKKMSKSYNNTLPIFESEDVIRKKISSIVTDSTPKGEPIDTSSPLCSILKFVTEENEYEEIINRCKKGDITYKELKEILEKNYFSYFEKARKKYNILIKKPNKIDKIIKKSDKKVKKVMDANLEEVKKSLGIS